MDILILIFIRSINSSSMNHRLCERVNHILLTLEYDAMVPEWNAGEAIVLEIRYDTVVMKGFRDGDQRETKPEKAKRCGWSFALLNRWQSVPRAGAGAGAGPPMDFSLLPHSPAISPKYRPKHGRLPGHRLPRNSSDVVICITRAPLNFCFLINPCTSSLPATNFQVCIFLRNPKLNFNKIFITKKKFFFILF